MSLINKNNFPRVPYGLSVHGKEEINAVIKVLKTSTQMGKNVALLEKKVAKLFSKKYGLMMNSGSSSIMVAMEALKFPEGSEIITPALTFATTVGSIIKNNLVPVFIDSESSTKFTIDVNKIEEMITKKTKAMCIPNLMGKSIGNP